MTRAAALPLVALLLVIAPETTPQPELRGWASAYAPGRMEEVVRYRLDTDTWRNPLPRDWYTTAGLRCRDGLRQGGADGDARHPRRPRVAGARRRLRRQRRWGGVDDPARYCGRTGLGLVYAVDGTARPAAIYHAEVNLCATQPKSI